MIKNEKKDIRLFHCVSSYPTPYKLVNLPRMIKLQRIFNRPVGLSDHSLGIEAAISAVAIGASIIEKHVTLDKNLPGPDHKTSASIEEFANLVKAIRNVEACMENHSDDISSDELKIRDFARKSLCLNYNLPKGHIISNKDLCLKRPGTGISPLKLESILGKQLVTDVKSNHLLKESDFR